MKKKICEILIAVLVAVLGASTYFIIEHYHCLTPTFIIEPIFFGQQKSRRG